MPALNYKEEAKKQWSNDPAGALYSGYPRGSKEFFEEVRAYRYQTHPWILELITHANPRGKKVLEVGIGLGNDLLEFARAGAHVTGIDLTETNIELAKQNFSYAHLFLSTCPPPSFIPLRNILGGM